MILRYLFEIFLIFLFRDINNHETQKNILMLYIYLIIFEFL